MKRIFIIAILIVALAFIPAMACKEGDRSGKDTSTSSDQSSGRGQSDNDTTSEDREGNGQEEYPCDILIFGPDCDAFERGRDERQN